MAKKKLTRSTALAIRHALARPHIARPIVVRQTKIVKPKRRGHRRGGGLFGGGTIGGLFKKERVGIVMGAAAVGMLEASGMVEKLPAVPIIGRLGTTGLIAYLLSDGGRNKLFDEICTSAFVLAAHEYATTGKVVGDGMDGPEFVQSW